MRAKPSYDETVSDNHRISPKSAQKKYTPGRHYPRSSLASPSPEELQIVTLDIDMTTDDANQRKTPTAETEKPATVQGVAPTVSNCYRAGVFALLVLTQAVTNFDSGAIGAVLGKNGAMSKEFGSSGSLDGMLASISYLGNSVGGVTCGYLFAKYHPKPVLSHSLLLHTIFSIGFSASPHVAMAIIARFGMGVTQSYIIVYTPVWVNVFAPSTSSSTWMALSQAGVPIGIMLGYLTAGLLAANTAQSWRLSFFIKSVLLVPIVFMTYFLGREALQKRTTEEGAAEGSRQEFRSSATWVCLKRLWRNSLYVATVSALCSLYFVVTALQMWITAYLNAPPIRAELNQIVAAFGITSATAPVLGVITGGVFLDKIGGYKQIDRAAMMGAGSGFIAVTCVVISLVITDFWFFIVLVWLLLFFGGAIVPSATGLFMACVDKDLQNVASSYAAVTFSLFGYFLGPLLCGVLAEVIELAIAFRIVMMWSVIAFTAMVRAAYLARHIVKKQRYLQEQQGQQEEGPDVSEGRDTPPTGRTPTLATNSCGGSEVAAGTRDTHYVVTGTMSMGLGMLEVLKDIQKEDGGAKPAAN